MERFIFTCLLLVHGLIHTIGFVKEFKSDKLGQATHLSFFQLMANKPFAVLWFIPLILFAMAAAFYIMRKEWWLQLTAIAVVFSQMLIVFNWQEAKFGTIVNAIIFIIVLITVASNSFEERVKNEVKALSSQEYSKQRIVSGDMLEKLPDVVKLWLERSNVLGKQAIQTVHLKQEGEMRVKPNGGWMEVKAEQFFTVPKPGFIWFAGVRAAPLVHLKGRDKYMDGKGQMLIKLLSIIPVVNSSGPEIDQGTLVRYLAEIVWFPSAALCEYIEWEEVDAHFAKATMKYNGVKASGVFKFDENGDVISFEAERFYDRRSGATLEKWLVEVEKGAYKEFQGIRVPVRSAVTWKLNEGDFTWFKLQITDIEYNKKEVEFLSSS